MDIKFSPNLVKEADDYYKKLRVASDQKYIIIGIGKLMKEFIPLPERSIRGFIWISIKDWQTRYKRDLSELSKLNPAERIEDVKQIINIFRIRLKKVLINKEQEPLLEEAMQKALDVYIDKFAYR